MGWIQLSRSAVAQYTWRSVGTLTTAQTALTTNKSSSAVAALTSTGTAILNPVDNTVALEWRFKGVATDGDNNVLNVYAIRNPKGVGDHYTLIATLTLTTGTQTDGTNLFVDTITKTNEKWSDEIVIVNDAANGIARVALNTHGYTDFLFIATTLNSTSVIIDSVRE